MLDLSGYTPEQLKELVKQANEIVKAQEPELEKKRKARKLPKILKKSEVERFLTAINTDTPTGLRQMAIVQTFLRTGVRVQELCNLTVADVDLIKGSLYIQLGKGGKDRHVSFGAELLKWLKAWEEIRPESEWFFCSRKGTQLFQRNIRETCYEISKRSGVYIQDGKSKHLVSCHKLRHTCATDWLNAGMTLIEIQGLLGHESLATTERYLHIDNVMLDKKIKDLG